ncbi:MAG: GC-type dockerin domain-anchored protein [Planctomycetota bacterium]
MRHLDSITIQCAAVALLAPLASAQVVTRFVDPLATDPEIVEVELPLADGVPLEHFVAVNPSNDNGRLFVWLSGSGGAPGQYQALSTTAAEIGYDVVGLVYDSWPAVNLFTTNDTDPTLPERIRRERLFGEDLFDEINVNPANSVVNRLAKIIQHQSTNHPAEPWSRYLTPSGEVNWRRVVVGGHSQGAGHTAYLTKAFELDGALLIAGPGDFVQGLGTAPWVFEPSLTPADRCFAFTHVDDPTAPGFFGNQRILGLDAFGPIESVDGKAAFQIDSHMLASVLPVPPGDAHSAVAVDALLPLDANGVPVYRPAWLSMFTRVAPGPCTPADITSTSACEPGLSDGAVDLSDFSCYLSLWAASDPAADLTTIGACQPGTGGDGVTLSDFACYLGIWSVGCP